MKNPPPVHEFYVLMGVVFGRMRFNGPSAIVSVYEDIIGTKCPTALFWLQPTIRRPDKTVK